MESQLSTAATGRRGGVLLALACLLGAAILPSGAWPTPASLQQQHQRRLQRQPPPPPPPRRPRSFTATVVLFGSTLDASSSSSATTSTSSDLSIRIRDCTYVELPQVADVIIAAFYSNTTNPWRQMYRMAELNRIQQGYPYQKYNHRMFVAVLVPNDDNDGDVAASMRQPQKIIGFCDVDDRTPNRPTSYQYNPRPYLSDLCVHPSYHRRGVAQQLVAACERFCRDDLQPATGHLYIRVEASNQPALQMYTQKLGYQVIQDDEGHGAALHAVGQGAAAKSQILLLQKSLETM